VDVDLTEQVTQREAADRSGVVRSVVVTGTDPAGGPSTESNAESTAGSDSGAHHGTNAVGNRHGEHTADDVAQSRR
jgi:hypothetical protein